MCEAYARRGRIPADALARIRQKSRVDIGRILEIQTRVKHEMIALLTSLEEERRRHKGPSRKSSALTSETERTKARG